MSIQGVKKAFYLADIHYPLHDKKCFRIYQQIIKDWKPDYLVFLGDCFNATGISKFTLRDYEDGIFDTVDEIQGFRKDYFEPLARACGKPVIKWILGNHDGRRIDYTLEKVEAKCCRKKFLDYKDKLDLQKYFPEVEFTRYPDCDNIGKLYLTHGEYHNDAHTKKHALVYGKSVLYGHLHTDDRKTVPTKANNRVHTAYSMPCACKLGVDYMLGKASSWVQGYAYGWHYSDGYFDIEVKKIIRGRTIFEGKLYTA